MDNTKTPEQVIAERLNSANNALTAFRHRTKTQLEGGPAWLHDFAKDAWAVVEAHTEVSKENSKVLEDGVREVIQTHRGAIYYGLVERGELDAGFGLLHDTIHDAAQLTTSLYFLAKKW